ncbi:flagellar export protein FliJ [Yersinia aleksiciae]|uniref:Flagellar FliJ protein n=1 Tax=Yersinia aleksiciae TaxID=263819 RepID=A0A0T9U5U9_YERAE|nr:flagellar export protein FliJ [Yersinia aleksiciae]AKP33116.1 flagellar export protein FliJ [Yersinia aleksiciae]MDN0122240.1 flagellar export protein FliJ [Yersinia aleksiciae]CFQ48821.1 flagellar export protein FliJ [Yersinia aleksiciae]CNL21461.1 flagellar export protein FliJ [Yersinia aleksiciae]
MSEQKMVKTLQRLQQLRQRALNQTTSQLAQQKQLCQRYQNNINALTSLTHFSFAVRAGACPTIGAFQMTNSAHYKRHIQRVIDWQKQEQTLADMEAGKLQVQLQQQACREKIVAVVVEQQQQLYQMEQGRREQKITDNLAAQCWLRGR